MAARARLKAAIKGRAPLTEEAAAAGSRGQVVRLHSYIVPALPADNYSVSVTQDVQVGGSLLGTLKNGVAALRKFTIDAPRFSIPGEDVLSVFPPPGAVDLNNALPYIIFREPSLPWERCVQRNAPTVPASPDDGIVPWIALVALEQTELLTDPGLLLNATCNPTTGIFNAALTDILEPTNPGVMCPLSNCLSSITDEEKVNTRLDTIMVQPQVFAAMIWDQYDPDTRNLQLPVSPQTKPGDITRYKYLAHLRESLGDSDGLNPELHSAMFSHRTAPTGIKTQTAILVHLVSLEGWEYVNLPLAPTVQAVALTSLYSWTYSVLPSPSVTFLDKMTQLGTAPKYKTGMKPSTPTGGIEWQGDFRMLRLPEETILRLDQNNVLYSKATQIMKKRLFDGYSVTKYILPTGETVPAFTRGPLSPVPVPDNILLSAPRQRAQKQLNDISFSDKVDAESFTAAQSSYGKDFEILDRDLGIVDISYSAAWQLGRLLGLSNQDFSSALTNLRRDSINEAFIKAKLSRRKAMEQKDDPPPHDNDDSDASFMGWMLFLTFVALSLFEYPTEGDSWLVNNPSRLSGGIPYPRSFRNDRRPGMMVEVGDDEGLQSFNERFPSQLRNHIMSHSSSNKLSSSKSGGDVSISGSEGLQPFNELNPPNSNTYPLILKFLLDLKHLEGIPIHYLFADPAYLPPETMRFFYIDPNWINSVMDGALSIGNTLEMGGNDLVKHFLKAALDRYSKTELDKSRAGHKPQSPKFGFFIRSEVLTAWTDLRVAAPFPNDDWRGDKVEILETRRVAQDTIMVLLDRCPEDKATAENIPSTASDEVRSRLLASVTPASDPIYLLDSITISQPPHQQGFSLGTQLTETQLKIPAFWDVDPSDTNGQRPWKLLEPEKTVFTPEDKDLQIYDWKNKIIRVKDLMGMIAKTMKIDPADNVPSRFKTTGPVLFALNMGSGILHMDIDKLRHDEPSAKWPPAQKSETVVQETLSSGKTKGFSADQEDVVSAEGAETGRVTVEINPTTGTTSSTMKIMSGAGRIKRRSSVKVIAGFETLRLAKLTPANKYVVAIPRPPHMPRPIPDALNEGSLLQPALGIAPNANPLLVTRFSAMGLSLPYIPIVAGPGRDATQPPTVDLLVIITASVPPPPWHDIVQVRIEFPLTHNGVKPQDQLATQRLTKCYAGLGPRLLNRPRWRVQLKLAESDRLQIMVGPRGKRPVAKVHDLSGMALLLPGVRTDAETSGEVLVGVEVTTRNQNGEESSDSWLARFKVRGGNVAPTTD
ncbi:hypothetical protein FOXYSP1_11611 [Fusarium oxysporum f. sp. phaseoli]